MKVLALDISTNTGWALFQDAQLFSFGVIKKPEEFNRHGTYPYDFLSYAEKIADQIVLKVKETNPNHLVIEETNKTGRFGSRHSQKLLEFIHCFVLLKLVDFINNNYLVVFYVNTSDWRKKLNLSVAETKKKAKPYIKKYKELKVKAKKDKSYKKELEQLKKELKTKCIHGKIDKKSISVAHVNLVYTLNLKKGDNDISDAICIGEAFLNGVNVLLMKDIFQ